MTEVIQKKVFIDKIRKQNDCIRESTKMNVVNIEVVEGKYESLLSVGPIYIGWDSCRVYQWVIKSGRDKISARGSQIGPNVHHTDKKLKDQKETNRQTDRIRQYNKMIYEFHQNP
jgi:hypothetical protein